MNYKYEEENISNVQLEEKQSMVYLRSEGEEGIIVSMENGKITSVVYDNVSDEKALDVRKYKSRINEDGTKEYSVEIYRSVSDINRALGIIEGIE